MATGKNKVEKGFRLWFDDSGATARDLSGDLVPGSVSGGGFTFDEADMTGVSNAAYNYLKGHAMSEIGANFHINDTATTGSSVVINGHNTGAGTGTLTLQWGASGAAPTTGDLEFEGEYVLLDAKIALDGNKFVYQCIFKPTGATAPAFGTVA